MELREIINLLRKEKLKRMKDLHYRVSHISKLYIVAMHDLKVIKNTEDVINVLDYIIEELEDVQDRIIDRNKKSLV